MNKITKLFLFISLTCSAAHAQTIKVKQIKGNKAIVEFSGNLQPETTYNIGNNKKGLSTDEESHQSSRNNLIGFTGIISNLQKTTSGVTTNRNTYYLGGTFGWNTGTFEYGPSLSYASIDIGSGATTQYTVGGFFDWDIQPNISQNSLVYGLGINAQYGSTTPPSGATSTTTNNFYPSGFLKWFILGSPVALRLDLGYRYTTDTTGSTTSTTSGVDIEGGFSIYY